VTINIDGHVFYKGTCCSHPSYVLTLGLVYGSRGIKCFKAQFGWDAFFIFAL
jgi:hypothetical protein